MLNTYYFLPSVGNICGHLDHCTFHFLKFNSKIPLVFSFFFMACSIATLLCWSSLYFEPWLPLPPGIVISNVWIFFCPCWILRLLHQLCWSVSLKTTIARLLKFSETSFKALIWLLFQRKKQTLNNLVCSGTSLLSNTEVIQLLLCRGKKCFS